MYNLTLTTFKTVKRDLQIPVLRLVNSKGSKRDCMPISGGKKEEVFLHSLSS